VRKETPDSKNDRKPPSPRELAILLGSSYAAFEALTGQPPRTQCEWRRYGKKSPWVLKVIQDDRTLFYVTPKRGKFEVTVVLGERAVEAALTGRVREALHASIRAAKPYIEGRSIRIVVVGEAGLAGVKELVAIKLKPDAALP